MVIIILDLNLVFIMYLSSLFSDILTEVLQVAKDMVSGQQKKKLIVDV